MLIETHRLRAYYDAVIKLGEVLIYWYCAQRFAKLSPTSCLPDYHRGRVKKTWQSALRGGVILALIKHDRGNLENGQIDGRTWQLRRICSARLMPMIAGDESALQVATLGDSKYLG